MFWTKFSSLQVRGIDFMGVPSVANYLDDLVFYSNLNLVVAPPAAVLLSSSIFPFPSWFVAIMPLHAPPWPSISRMVHGDLDLSFLFISLDLPVEGKCTATQIFHACHSLKVYIRLPPSGFGSFLLLFFSPRAFVLLPFSLYAFSLLSITNAYSSRSSSSATRI